MGWAKCEDIACFFDNFPGELMQFKDRFADIYIEPNNDEEAQAAIDSAMALMQEVDLLNWFNGSSCRFEYLTPLFFELFDLFLESEGSMYWHWPNAWNPECTNVWADSRFRDYVDELRLEEYWRHVGEWPAACRPEGDSYVCGQP